MSELPPTNTTYTVFQRKDGEPTGIPDKGFWSYVTSEYFHLIPLEPAQDYIEREFRESGGQIRWREIRLGLAEPCDKCKGFGQTYFDEWNGREYIPCSDCKVDGKFTGIKPRDPDPQWTWVKPDALMGMDWEKHARRLGRTMYTLLKEDAPPWAGHFAREALDSYEKELSGEISSTKSHAIKVAL